MNLNDASTGWSNPFFIVLGLVALSLVVGFTIGLNVAAWRAKAGRPPGGDHRGEVGATSEAWVDETMRDVESRSVALLRSRRHAFLNHLQVISGWLQLGNVDRATSYIDRVLRDMEPEGRFIRAADPALVAFLLAKAEQARSRGVDLTTSVDSGLAAAEEVAADVAPALDGVIDQLIAASPRSGSHLRLELSEGGGRYHLTIEATKEADSWLGGALAAAEARREAPGRWVVSWPEGR
ncbi:MAG: Spo0B domain-containing protein [Bacillota bacterium]